MAYTVLESEIGPLVLTANDSGLTGIYFGRENSKIAGKEGIPVINTQYNDSEDPGHPILRMAVQELKEYFKNKRKHFTIPLSIEGTEFQKAVWKELTKIPYGETRSYQDIACAIQKQKAVRAVGQANKANRFPIIIPCHRVIGKNQSMTGYAGKEIDKKEILLKIEGVL
ncbi:methylated-DNA--[protein]-cysteine S-methyltransferase [Heyndrickxia acidicola]|uniref:Methylated-DNA--protein-cysteine methyltransferase n=1 Tax=Heyndrickxia acidicola TaxID=209389 RepID=A0ABU6MIR8_9BACI|nr:methylated-DNA--[protein]-cysteine S-methyltransferase [Heyndrickxia acidicola]MED1204292.1 methylated-DNA--[protein]-cysteine S-methyltransferase [Heyndrickxia acidicola]